MATILLAWELGGGLGHLVPLRVLGEELIARGHQVVGAFRELSFANSIFDGTEIKILPAPYKATSSKVPIDPPYTFAHLLHNVGFADQVELLGLTKAWQTIYQYVRPDLVVLDHSPTALLALHGIQARRILCGVGFAAPPDEHPMPCMRPWPPANPGRLIEDEHRVLQIANGVLGALKCPFLPRLSALFANVDGNFLLTFQELDHFAGRSSKHYYGTLSCRFGNKLAWPNCGGPRVFAYLKQFPAISCLLGMLKEHAVATVVVGDDFDPTLRERFESANMRFESQFVDIMDAAERCDFAILNASHGTTAAMLLAGKPMLLLPISLEQYITAVRVERLGAGIGAPPSDPQQIATALQSLLNLNSFRHHAREFAEKYSTWSVSQAVQRVADELEKTLGC